MTETIVYILVGINVLTFVVYGVDKWNAKQGKWRISEATLLLLAVIGGTIGAVGRLCLQCGSDRIRVWNGHTCPKCQGEMEQTGEKEFWT